MAPRVTFCAYDKTADLGGPLTWLQRLLPCLQERGFEVRCLFLLHEGTTGPTVEFLRTRGIECPAILAPDTTEERIRWILERLRENPPDIFVANLVVAGYWAGRWLKEAGVRTVGVLHSDEPFYQGIQDQFVFGEPKFQVDALVAVSSELHEQVQRTNPRRPTLYRIGCGAPIPNARVRPPSTELKIAYVGRLAEEQKRIADVANAFCEAAEKLPGIEGVIFGDGPERGQVEKILGSRNSSGSVRLGGLVESAHIQKVLLEFHVIVLLSDYEGLPIALMEGMACGCVPVCKRMRSGIPELVIDGETGLLVDDGEEGFVAAIRRLRGEPDLWDRLSKAARQKIENEHSAEKSCRKWAELLKDLASKRTSTRPISIPSRLRLPPVHPDLAGADQRRQTPPLPVRCYRKSRMTLGRWRRTLFGA
jgi:colanic acid/amylovoran biosynthesis glycosyltransferase